MTSNIGRLSVNTEPGRPRIKTSEDVLMVEVGDEVDLECQSTGGRPAGQLDWWNADTGEQIISEVTTSVHRAGETFTIMRSPPNILHRAGHRAQSFFVRTTSSASSAW